MKAHALEDRFLDYLEGTLSEQERAAFEAELKADPDLSASFEAYQEVLKAEAFLREEEFSLSPNFTVKVMDAIEAQPRTLVERVAASFGMQPKMFLGTVATLATLVLIIRVGSDVSNDAISTRSTASSYKQEGTALESEQVLAEPADEGRAASMEPLEQAEEAPLADENLPALESAPIVADDLAKAPGAPAKPIRKQLNEQGDLREKKKADLESELDEGIAAKRRIAPPPAVQVGRDQPLARQDKFSNQMSQKNEAPKGAAKPSIGSAAAAPQSPRQREYRGLSSGAVAPHREHNKFQESDSAFGGSYDNDSESDGLRRKDTEQSLGATDSSRFEDGYAAMDQAKEAVASEQVVVTLRFVQTNEALLNVRAGQKIDLFFIRSKKERGTSWPLGPATFVSMVDSTKRIATVSVSNDTAKFIKSLGSEVSFLLAVHN